MAQRMTATDAALLAADTRTTPQHIGSVDIFVADVEPGGEVDVDAVAELIEQRLEFVPRYRMRPRSVPGGIALPVWVEDEGFDPSFHIRHSALPRPGSLHQLDEFVGRVLARALDLSRPLWECYIVEGLQPDPESGRPRFALVTKSHQTLVDGIDAVELGQVLLDDPADLMAYSSSADDDENDFDGRRFEPLPEPRPLDLVVDAVREGLSGPQELVDTGRRGLTSAINTVAAAGEALIGGGSVGDWAESTLRGSRGPVGTPFGGAPSQHRRFVHVELPLAELTALRQPGYTINDVVLAVVVGGLRSWLSANGRLPKDLLALVPMSVADTDGEPSALGSHVAPHLISLPLSESNPLMRLHQISHGTRAHTDTGLAVSARAITDIAGFAPMTLHTLGVRASASLVLRPHHLLVTNAPGPQHPLQLAGHPMTASYPILPIERGRLLSIGITSYNGMVFFGLSADRDQVPGLDLLASCMSDAVIELRATAEDTQTSARLWRETQGAGGGTQQGKPDRQQGTPGRQQGTPGRQQDNPDTNNGNEDS